MKTLLNVINASFSRGSLPLFENISFSINTGDRIGFVGHNGCGKSTLLSLLTGAEELDEGEVRMPRGQRVAQVEQFVPLALGRSPLIEAVLDVIAADLRQGSRYRAEELLQELGFSAVQQEIPLQMLSGGQQNLALLARAIILQPELLLMDEPGNHMDVLALTYLQNFLLSDSHVPYLLISHDRELLNKCCNRTIFLRDCRLFSFDLPFDQAAQALAEHDLQAAKSRQAEEKEIKRLQSSAKRLALWGKTYDNENLARKAKSMQKRVDRLKQEKTLVTRGSGLELQVLTDSLRVKSLLTIEKLLVMIADTDHVLLEVGFQHIRPGDRIALLGKNGVGKSTTISRLIRAIKKHDESVRYNPNVKLGYYDQQLEQFSMACSRKDWLRERSELSDERIQQVLLQNGVPFSEIERSVDKLSGGERARLMFMLFQLNRPNFLVLDEPTNHIDIQGREALERQLIESNATLLITSHDRRFVERVANRWWWINEKQLIELNDLEEFYDAVKQDVASNQSLQRAATTAQAAVACEAFLSEDEKLVRVVELERLLKEDKARKAKFQKPKLQQQWQRELSELWEDLQ